MTQSLFCSIQAAAPYLKETRGSVVNVADIQGERPNAPFNVYCITKATIIMITKSLALELAPEVRFTYTYLLSHIILF